MKKKKEMKGMEISRTETEGVARAEQGQLMMISESLV